MAIFKPRTFGSRGILLHNKHILLSKNIGRKKWTLPGGKMKKGETPEECLFREIEEELAITLSAVDYKLGEYFSSKEGKKDTISIFVVSLSTFDFTIQPELQAAQWFPLENLPTDISKATAKKLAEFKQGKKHLLSVW